MGLSIMRFIFRPICWISGWWRTITRNVNISGHDYIIKQENFNPFTDDLVCEVCGYKSKAGER